MINPPPTHIPVPQVRVSLGYKILYPNLYPRETRGKTRAVPNYDIISLARRWTVVGKSVEVIGSWWVVVGMEIVRRTGMSPYTYLPF